MSYVDGSSVAGGLLALYILAPIIILGLCIWCCYCCCCRRNHQTIVVPGGGGGSNITNMVMPAASNMYSPNPQNPTSAPAPLNNYDNQKFVPYSPPQPGLNPPPYANI